MVKKFIFSLCSRAAGGGGGWRRRITANAAAAGAARRRGSIEGMIARFAEIGAANPGGGFHTASAWFRAQGGDSGDTVTIDYGSIMPEKEFHSIANETLHHLQEKIDEYGEKLSIDGFDTDYAEGVLTVRLGDLGTYVINKQAPNRQIWLSSPLSGPARFDWQESQWVYRRTKAELQSLLEKELSQLLGQSINLGK